MNNWYVKCADDQSRMQSFNSAEFRTYRHYLGNNFFIQYQFDMILVGDEIIFMCIFPLEIGLKTWWIDVSNISLNNHNAKLSQCRF